MNLREGLSLLGYPPSRPSQPPSAAAPLDVDQVIHFLLYRLDPCRCAQVSRGCWPIIEPSRDGRQFRLSATKLFLEWKEAGRLRCTVRKGILDERVEGGRLLGELLCELMIMIMRKEIGEVDAVEDVSLEELIQANMRIVEQIEDVKSKTEEFVNRHPVPTLSEDPYGPAELAQLDGMREFLDDIPDVALVFRPPAMLVEDLKMEEYLESCKGILTAIPRPSANPHIVHEKARQLQILLGKRHAELSHQHKLLARQTLETAAATTWSVDKETMDLVL